MRQTLLGQNSGNHRAIPPGALHAKFEALAATLLKVVNIAQDKVVDRQGQIVRSLLDRLFCHLFRFGVERQWDFSGGDFIQGSLFNLFFVKTVPCLQGGQFVSVNVVQQAFIMAFEPFVLANYRPDRNSTSTDSSKSFLAFSRKPALRLFSPRRKLACERAIRLSMGSMSGC